MTNTETLAKDTYNVNVEMFLALSGQSLCSMFMSHHTYMWSNQFSKQAAHSHAVVAVSVCWGGGGCSCCVIGSVH